MNLEWTAPEHMYTQKTTDWYWIVAIVSATLTLLSILLGNTLFGILILVSSFTLALHASHPPKIIDIKVTDKGVQAGSTLYPYGSLESFWIEEKELHPRILLKSESKLAPYIVILLGDVPAEDIRQVLDTYLHEIKHSEPFLEKLLIWFGF
jgi:hypothetical protein